MDHVGELGMARASDAEILQEARQRAAFVVTLDADFHSLMALSGADRPSVLRLRMQGLDGATLVPLLISPRLRGQDLAALVLAKLPAGGRFMR